MRRLEAEAVRDALLAVSGQLDRTMGGSLLKVKNRGYFFDHTSKDLTDYTSRRRSLYLPVVRNNVYDVFQLLDFPDPAIPSGDRRTTTVAPQALLMLNSDLVMQAAADFADRLLDRGGHERRAACSGCTHRLWPRRHRQTKSRRNAAFLAAAERSLAAVEADAERAPPSGLERPVPDDPGRQRIRVRQMMHARHHRRCRFLAGAMLRQSAVGFGSLALASLLADESRARSKRRPTRSPPSRRIFPRGPSGSSSCS